MVRSATQRRGSTVKPLAVSERLTISTSMLRQARLEHRSLVAAVGIKLEQERGQAEQAGHHQHAAVAVLNVGPVNNRVHQQALRVHKDVTLAAFDLLARIVARRVDARAPFSAPLTLWLSTIAAVRLASRPAFSRQATYST